MQMDGGMSSVGFYSQGNGGWVSFVHNTVNSKRIQVELNALDIFPVMSHCVLRPAVTLYA